MASDDTPSLELSTSQLRRLKVFADLTDDQLATFVSLVEPVEVTLNNPIVRMNELGSSMYLILNGEAQVSRTTGGRETVLATLEAGDFFGEMCLFDETPRSANVIAARQCTLLKITRQAFDSMIETHPVLAALFLRAMLRIVAGRVRTMDKKYVDSMLVSYSWRKGSLSRMPPPGTAAHPR
ncbi:MAG TPA: cyclic nucleotide-binding domain-containing protein [Verrucomicrobiae bacterium]|nr:cyclic nucleotide-binding domain-containing protein [Verrucomicrobiae bacterium]